jgi:hypothetical protein
MFSNFGHIQEDTRSKKVTWRNIKHKKALIASFCRSLCLRMFVRPAGSCVRLFATRGRKCDEILSMTDGLNNSQSGRDTSQNIWEEKPRLASLARKKQDPQVVD